MQSCQQEIDKLQQELAVCRSRYNNLLASNSDIVWLAEKTGTIIYTNSSWQKYTGLENSEAVERAFLKSIHPEDRIKFKTKIERAVQLQNCWQISVRLKDFNDNYWSFNFEVKPIRDRQNRIVEWMGVGKKVEATERIKTELIAEKEFVKALLDNLAEGIVACDRQGVLALFNRATQEFHGLPQAAITATDWSEHYDLYHSDGKTLMKPEDIPLFRALQGESVRNVEMIIKPKNAKTRYILASGDPIITATGEKLGAVAAMRDISDRLEIERALKDSQIRFNGAFQQAAVGMAILSLEGRWLEANPALCNIIGYTQAELTQTTFQKLTHPEDLPRDLEYTRQLLSGERVSVMVEKRYLHKQGYPVWLNISTSIMRNEQNEPLYFVSLFQNITEARQTLQALEESEKRYRTIADNSSDLISIQSPEGIFLYVSPASRATLGYQPEEMIGKSIYDFLHPEDALLLTETPNKIEQYSEFYTYTYRFRDRDGSYIWLETTNRSLYRPNSQTIAEIVSISRNVSDRILAEVEIAELNQQLEQRVQRRTAQLEAADRQKDLLLIREREARTEVEQVKQKIELYADIVNNIQIGIMVWRLDNPQNPNSFKLIDLNPAAARLSMCDVSPTVDCYVAECFPRLVELKIPEACVEVIETQQVRDLGEVTNLNDCVSDLTFNLQAFPLPNRLVGLILEDITQRQQTQIMLQARATELTKINAMLLKTTAQLEKRNQELDRFAYVTSHDLKAPLRAIANLSQWIEEDLADKLTEDTRHQMNLLRGRVQRLENLINGLLAYSRIGRDRSKPKTIDVTALLQKIIRLIQLPSGFTVEIDDNMPTVVSEYIPLQQVFTNLISNAIAHHHRSTGKVSISVSDCGQFYRFSVSDDGPGINSDYHEKIFGIFQTLEARDRKEATGIGLSIVKKAVEERGGEIEVESELGNGSTFHFTWRKSVY
ncbi:PAS domain S-box protein [Myxosarcina sp. GI1]|uniref:PAS domain S-box protein n=1 Tax=Myxosarcina sp. GI1 TaxID=1541065 RepID=UPI0006911C7C|nr:PAS domain S-box protein [Myxosarcina sp. GI1]